MATKKINKSKNNIFAIVFSGLIILALALMVPLSMSSLMNGGTDNRGQAKVDTRPRSGKYLYLNTSATAPYMQTRYESPLFDLEANKEYVLSTAYVPYNIAGTLAEKGFIVALACGNPDNCGNVAPHNSFITSIAVGSISQSGIGKYTTKTKTRIKVRENVTGAQIRIFAHGGTEVAVDHVKLIEKSGDGRNLVPDGGFDEPQSQLLSRDFGNGWMEGNQSENRQYPIRANAGDQGMMIVRTKFSSDLTDNGELNPILSQEFTVPTQGEYGLTTIARMAKKRPGPNLPTAAIKIQDITNNQLIAVHSLPNALNNFNVSVPLSPGKTYKLEFITNKGSEWEVDTLGVKSPNGNWITENPFMAERTTTNINTQQPKQWTAGNSNSNFAYGEVVQKM